jgi:hypothetical protein
VINLRSSRRRIVLETAVLAESISVIIEAECSHPRLAGKPAVPRFRARHGVHKELRLEPTIVMAGQKLRQRAGRRTAPSTLLDESIPNRHEAATSQC